MASQVSLPPPLPDPAVDPLLIVPVRVAIPPSCCEYLSWLERKERKECNFRRYSNEKPSIVLGCPGLVLVTLVELGLAAALKCDDADGSVLVLQSQLAIEWSKKLQQAGELYPRGSWLGTHGTPSFDWTALPLTWSVLFFVSCLLKTSSCPHAGRLLVALWAPDLPPGMPSLPFKLAKPAMSLSQHHSIVPFLLECFTAPHQCMCLMSRTHRLPIYAFGFCCMLDSHRSSLLTS